MGRDGRIADFLRTAIFARAPPQRRDRPTDLTGGRSLGRSLQDLTDPKGPTVNHILPEDPAYERFELLVDALGNPALSGYESAALARLVSWSTADDIGALARLIRQARAVG
jgi:hypothetical protein